MLKYSCRKAIKCSVLECVNLENVAENNRALACKITERSFWVSPRFYVGYGCDIWTKNMWFLVNWGWTVSWVSRNQHHEVKLWFVRTDTYWIKQQVKQWQSLNLKRNPWIHKIFLHTKQCVCKEASTKSNVLEWWWLAIRFSD